MNRNIITKADLKKSMKVRRNKCIYISGPMTGMPEYNFPEFNRITKEWRAEGWEVRNPAEKGELDGWEWEDYLRYDLIDVAQCDSLAQLRGWSKSRGAKLEYYVAKKLGLTIYDAYSKEVKWALI